MFVQLQFSAHRSGECQQSTRRARYPSERPADSALSLGSHGDASVHMVGARLQFMAEAKPVVRTALRALFEAMHCLHAPTRSLARAERDAEGFPHGPAALRLHRNREQFKENPAEQQSIIISSYQDF